jgi:hypothetical protein
MWLIMKTGYGRLTGCSREVGLRTINAVSVIKHWKQHIFHLAFECPFAEEVWTEFSQQRTSNRTASWEYCVDTRMVVQH